MEAPKKSQIETWTTTHLETAAKLWTERANLMKENYATAQNALSGAHWSGSGADQAQDRLFRDLVDIRGAEDQLLNSADVAKKGAEAIADARRAALASIQTAKNLLFDVSEELAVTDRLPAVLQFPFLRELQRKQLESEIRGRAMQLAETDDRIASELKAISASLREFNFDGTGSTPDPGSSGEPKIAGPAGPLKYEQDKYDLQVTFPDGKGPTFGGDPATHDAHWDPIDEIPRDPDSEKASDEFGKRTIPTGTALGPNGERIAFFSYPDGKEVQGTNPYSTPGKAWDFTDPDHPQSLGPVTYVGPDGKSKLPIYQPTGAYDKATGKMVVIGNITNQAGKIERYMFEADIKPGQTPADWMHSLHMSGKIEGMPGARESQLVALEGGGFALVGSDNYSDNPKDPRQAVSAVVASSTEGLKTAVPTTILGPSGTIGDHGLAAPYGPTVMGTTYDPATGKETIDLRVSTWDGVNIKQPEPPAPRVPLPYDPQTYTTSITVQH